MIVTVVHWCVLMVMMTIVILLHSQGLKEDPESAVLYSNRSAALLQLTKAGKALDDAEECIKRRPDWDKGWFRKGLALELSEKYAEVGLQQAWGPWCWIIYSAWHVHA